MQLTRRHFLKKSALALPQLSLLSTALTGALPSLATVLSGCSSTGRKLSSETLATYLPGSAEYEKLYATYNAETQAVHPQLIAAPRNENDVIEALAWAKLEGIAVHLRSGGHCFEDFSTGPGMVLDLQALNTLDVDPSQQIIRVGAGARLGRVAAALSPHGLVLPTGSCTQVGVTGLTLGGGYGFLSRKFGMTCDSLREITLIDARGKRWRASEKENPELFWAHRGGGGGNFGVITQLVFAAHEAPKLSVLTASVPRAKARELLRVWQDSITQSPDELSVILFYGCGKKGAGDPLILAQYVGDKKSAREAMAPFLKLLKTPAPKIQELDPLAATEFFGGKVDAPFERAAFKSKSHYFNDALKSDVWSDALRFLEIPLPAGALGVILDPYRGAISRMHSDATAFAHRDALFSIQYRGDWSTAAQGEEKPHVMSRLNELYAELAPHSNGSYVNYCDKSLTDWKNAYYGKNLARLEAIKRQFDPNDFFRHAQSL